MLLLTLLQSCHGNSSHIFVFPGYNQYYAGTPRFLAQGHSEENPPRDPAQVKTCPPTPQIISHTLHHWAMQHPTVHTGWPEWKWFPIGQFSVCQTIVQSHDSLSCLALSQTTNFRMQNWKSKQTKILDLPKTAESSLKGRKHCGKMRNCLSQAISPFPTVFSKDLYFRQIKTRACLGKVEQKQILHI